MALFNDRRTNVIHDIGMNAAPDHDPAAGLQGWASAHASARQGLAAALMPAPIMHGSPNVLPGQQNAPRLPGPRPQATDFQPTQAYLNRDRAPVRPAAVASRTASWGGGSMPASQSVLPGQPMRVSSQRTQNVLPGFAGQKLMSGPSFAQKARRAVRGMVR